MAFSWFINEAYYVIKVQIHVYEVTVLGFTYLIEYSKVFYIFNKKPRIPTFLKLWHKMILYAVILEGTENTTYI